MPGFQSSVGLISGLPITDVVDQLMAIAQKPRERLEFRAAGLRQQQVAIGELTALTIATQLATNKLANASVFQQRTASSSDSNLLAASVTGEPAAGTYQFTPVRMAQNHQLISSGFTSLDEPVGVGSLSLGYGGFADRGMDLSMLNGGVGVERGKIRITDRSGSSAVVDLRYVQTVDDVLDQINRTDDVDVVAVADGDAIRLVDQTGLNVTNLVVREVGGGNTATDLGLGGIDVAASEATGNDLVGIYDQLDVSLLNDGAGLSIRDELVDLEIQFRDGSAALQIDLVADDIKTFGDLLDTLNAADPTRLTAAISADGKRLVLTDLTADSGGTFAVSSGTGGTLAEDLGLTGVAAGDALTGERLLGGLKGPLLKSLGGGNGLAALGQISLTDRAGTTATVDLAGAETLNDVIDLINSASVGITASINAARNGIALRDTTGAAASNLVVANADATNSADVLGLTVDAAQTTHDGGSLHLQVVNENTRLDTLNNGEGVKLGSILLTDTTGATSGANLQIAEVETVGDVLDLINGLGLALEARINDTGDGIALVDTAGGTETMEVRESGTGTTAADLKLFGQATVVDIGGTPTQVIDGAMTAQVAIDADDTLQDVVDKINELDMGVTASIFQSGSGTAPYRIALTSKRSGAAGEIMLDASQFGLGFQEIASAQDAILQVGSADLPGAGILATSSTNQFKNVVEGVQLTIGGVSDSPVTISVETSDASLVDGVKLLVDQYNKLQDKIKGLTFFDAESETTGILMGSNETLQIESRLTRLLTSRFFGVGSIQSLEQLGIGFNNDGKLELDELKLQDKFAEDPDGVTQFFTDEEQGFAAKFNEVIDGLAGENDSLLIGRNDTLQKRIDTFNERIEFHNERLDKERDRLLKYYYNLELALSKIKSSQSALASLSPLPPMTGSSG